MNVTIRQLGVEDMVSVGEVNRGETIEFEYAARPAHEGEGLALHKLRLDPPIDVPPWSREALEQRVASWKAEIEHGGLLLGAFSDGRLVGFAVQGRRQSDNSAELAAIFVDRDHRRRSIGSSLIRAVEDQARRRKLSALFIKSVPTAATVDFYRRHGYRIISVIDKSLVRHLPWDVVLAKAL